MKNCNQKLKKTGLICNPNTGRWVNSKGKLGKRLKETLQVSSKTLSPSPYYIKPDPRIKTKTSRKKGLFYFLDNILFFIGIILFFVVAGYGFKLDYHKRRILSGEDVEENQKKYKNTLNTIIILVISTLLFLLLSFFFNYKSGGRGSKFSIFN